MQTRKVFKLIFKTHMHSQKDTKHKKYRFLKLAPPVASSKEVFHDQILTMFIKHIMAPYKHDFVRIATAVTYRVCDTIYSSCSKKIL